MKLINYEEYKNKLLEIRDSIPLTVPAATYELMREKPYAQGMAMRGGIRKALKCLEECQNVSDVAPVVYGHWIWHEEEFEYECSACHCRFDYNHTFEIFDHGFQYANYCPNCGAKMNESKWEGVQHNG